MRERGHFKDPGVDRKIVLKVDLREVGWGDIDWIDLAHDRDRWRVFCECGNEPSGSIKCGGYFE